MALLSMNNVSFSYGGGAKDVLRGVSAGFEGGKIYTISGESGSGKTTLLSLLAGLATSYSGEIRYRGIDIKGIDSNRYRSHEVGVIFQSYNLLLADTAAENVELSVQLSGRAGRGAKAIAYELLGKVRLDREKADRKVLKLSGGEQQRVAIARSLALDPNLIVADEPTGNLDEKNETGIMEIFQKLAREEGKCVVIVTHSKTVPEYADIKLQLKNGQLAAADGAAAMQSNGARR